MGAAVAVFAAGVIGREFVRSGAVAEGLLSHWYGHVGVTRLSLSSRARACTCWTRAYRRR